MYHNLTRGYKILSYSNNCNIKSNDAAIMINCMIKRLCLDHG